jgi:hypothetical protein
VTDLVARLASAEPDHADDASEEEGSGRSATEPVLKEEALWQQNAQKMSSRLTSLYGTTPTSCSP